MLTVIANHLGMLIAMWVVLILLGLGILIRLVVGLRGSVTMTDLATTITRPLLLDVLPVILLAWLTTIDNTGILLRIWYYAAAVVIVLRELLSLARSLKAKL